MTDVERMLLLGVDILIRTQTCPNDPQAAGEHFAELSKDIAKWRKVHGQMIEALALEDGK